MRGLSSTCLRSTSWFALADKPQAWVQVYKTRSGVSMSQSSMPAFTPLPRQLSTSISLSIAPHLTVKHLSQCPPPCSCTPTPGCRTHGASSSTSPKKASRPPSSASSTAATAPPKNSPSTTPPSPCHPHPKAASPSSPSPTPPTQIRTSPISANPAP